jgi:DNA-binding Lrp family transcriptional regulator
MVSGEFDLIVEVRCRNREHLASFIRDQLQQVTGVQRTVSSLVLHTYKLAEPSILDFANEDGRNILIPAKKFHIPFLEKKRCQLV